MEKSKSILDQLLESQKSTRFFEIIVLGTLNSRSQWLVGKRCWFGIWTNYLAVATRHIFLKFASSMTWSRAPPVTEIIQFTHLVELFTLCVVWFMGICHSCRERSEALTPELMHFNYRLSTLRPSARKWHTEKFKALAASEASHLPQNWRNTLFCFLSIGI